MEYAVTLHLLQLRSRHDLVDDPIRHDSSLSSQSQELLNADLSKLSRRVLRQRVSKPVALAARRREEIARTVRARHRCSGDPKGGPKISENAGLWYSHAMRVLMTTGIGRKMPMPPKGRFPVLPRTEVTRPPQRFAL